MKRLGEKFGPAFNGLKLGLAHRSIRVQYLLAVLAAAAGFWLRLSAAEWQTVIVCIGTVIAAEMLNTCIEELCNLHTVNPDERIRRIKDLAAGAVLAASIAALINAAMILANHLN
jgi:diacylglycerol kinase